MRLVIRGKEPDPEYRASLPSTSKSKKLGTKQAIRMAYKAWIEVPSEVVELAWAEARLLCFQDTKSGCRDDKGTNAS